MADRLHSPVLDELQNGKRRHNAGGTLQQQPFGVGRAVFRIRQVPGLRTGCVVKRFRRVRGFARRSAARYSHGGLSHRVNPACATRLAPPRGRCPDCSVGRSVHRVWIPRHGDGRSRDHTGGDTHRVPYRGTHLHSSRPARFEKTFTEQLLLTKRVSLTGREGQLVALIAQGLKNKELAYALGITEGTVKVYLSRVFKKLGVNDRFDLALYAIRNVVTGQNAGAELAHEPHTQSDAQPDILRLHSFLLPAPRSGTAYLPA